MHENPKIPELRLGAPGVDQLSNFKDSIAADPDGGDQIGQSARVSGVRQLRLNEPLSASSFSLAGDGRLFLWTYTSIHDDLTELRVCIMAVTNQPITAGEANPGGHLSILGVGMQSSGGSSQTSTIKPKSEEHPVKAGST
ncbi:MAG: hypothetical protein Q9184_006341, partial [Pyrenodesmia sp. 2 TL-2023]